MFPKHAKIKPAEQARQLELELREATKLAPAEREAKLRVLDERMQLLIDSVEDGCGLRLDGTLTHPPSGQQIWYDTTTVHTTCRSKIKKELALTRNRRAAGKEGKDMQSAGLMAVHQKKLDRYALLAALAERQVLDGLRNAVPAILPVAVSTHGEFCPGAVHVQEWLTAKYRERLILEGDRDDGEKLEDLTAAFRGEFRSSLLVAMCKGLADMLLAAGLPFAVKSGRGALRACTPAQLRALLSSPAPSDASPPAANSPGPDGPDLAEEVGADSDSADCSDTDSGVSDLEDENDVIDMQPAHPPRRSARLSAAADASQACSLVSPLSLVVCGGFPVVT